MSEKQYFHFTLGPVQSFVAQARRTRDFWAGSFILSWLSGVAMREVIAQCNGDQQAILFPKAEPNFLNWISGDGKQDPSQQGSIPKQGSIPNRFKAAIPADIDFKPQQVAEAVKTAWTALAELVYQQDIAGVSEIDLKCTRSIWDRQISHTWEIIWAMTDNVKDSALLDQRKNWRTYVAPEEPGVKCMMMDGWQELSGEASPNANNLENFWGKIRKSKKGGIRTDLRKKEYLCAIAFVKRRFPRHFAGLTKFVADNEIKMPTSTGEHSWALCGWDIDVGRPSVSYMAAVHWLEHTILQTHCEKSGAVDEALWAFHDAAYKMTKEYGGWDNDIHCIKEAKPYHKWKALDGNVFFTSDLENENNYQDPQLRTKVIQKLKQLKSVSGLSEASPFYAVLMMDGDSLGKQMSDPKKQPLISDGLQQFTQRVSSIVWKRNGFLVYAGGDDVLAVLPIEDALPCSLAIRECYEAIFAKAKAENDLVTSISAAIEFAHTHTPLTKVLRDAHSLLDDVAKERCGRDALAVRVWKPGGRVLEWAMPWEKSWEMYTDTSGNRCKRLVLERLVDDFKRDDHDGQLSNGFIYKLREQLELLNPSQDKQQGGSPLSFDQGVALMAAEYVDSGVFDADIERGQQFTHAHYVIKPLLEQCFPKYRDMDKPEEERFQSVGIYRADAAMLVRFLAQKEVG